MRSTKTRIRLEGLEGRALLATYVTLTDLPAQVVNDKVGTVDVNVALGSSDINTASPETFTLTTGGSAVPGVDYAPVPETITLTPVTATAKVTIPILPGPASLGTRTLQVSVPPTPFAPQGQVEFIVIQHGTDTTPPYVASSQALTQGGKVVAFAVQFSKPMAIGPVTNLANYVVGTPTSARAIAVSNEDGSLGLLTKTIPLKSATYDATTNTVYLVPVSKVKTSRNFFVESPDENAVMLQELFTKPSDNLLLPVPFSKLTDTSGNPIALSPNGGYDNYLGNFLGRPKLAPASPAVLSYLFGTPTHATPKAKPTHKHK